MIHCPHFNVCSGCSLDEQALNPPVYQKASGFFESVGLKNVPLVHEKLTHWRLKAKLAVRGTSQDPVIGLFKEGTHEVIDIPECKVHHPLINEAVLIIKKFIKKVGIEPYNELLRQGALRYLQLAVNRQSQTVQLSLIVNSMDGALNLINCLQNEKPELWHSFWINLNKGQTNRILGDEWIFVSGSKDFEEKILDQKIYFSPAGFSQANLDLFEQIVKEIVDEVKSGAKIVEYYAGVGTIGLAVAQKASSLLAVEYTEEAKEMFNKACPEKATYFVGPVKDYTHFIDDADIVIVDPPRKGLDPHLIRALKKDSSVNTLIYVSCGFESFERDTKELLSARWTLRKAKTYLLFAGSDHIETLAFFYRS